MACSTTNLTLIPRVGTILIRRSLSHNVGKQLTSSLSQPLARNTKWTLTLPTATLTTQRGFHTSNTSYKKDYYDTLGVSQYIIIILFNSKSSNSLDFRSLKGLMLRKLRKLTTLWPRNIIQIQTKAMPMPRKSFKRYQKPVIILLLLSILFYQFLYLIFQSLYLYLVLLLSFQDNVFQVLMISMEIQHNYN